MALSRVMSRGDLLSDLGQAVLPESARSVLAVFGFAGLKDYLRSTWDADSLLDRLATRLTQAVGETGRLYAPRRGELAALFEGGLGTSFTMIPAALDEEVSLIGIHTSYVLVFLPSEASTPAAALRLADYRLRAQSGNLRPERHP